MSTMPTKSVMFINDLHIPTATEIANQVIEEAVNSVILEAVRHFSTSKRPRSFLALEDDNRYLYSQKEVDAFFSKYNRDDVYCNIIKDRFGNVFCYELCRIPKDRIEELKAASAAREAEKIKRKNRKAV